MSLILWNQKVYLRVHKSPPPVRTLTPIDPVRAPTPFLQGPLLPSSAEAKEGVEPYFYPQSGSSWLVLERNLLYFYILLLRRTRTKEEYVR